jgi:two-component system, OmpR family, sensor kinase
VHVPGGIRVRLALALLAVVAVASLGAYLMIVPSLEARLVDAKLTQLESDAATGAALLASRLYQSQSRLDNAVGNLSLLYDATRIVVFDVYGPPATLQSRSDSVSTGLGALLKDEVALRTARTGEPASGRVRRDRREYAEAAVPLEGGTVILFSSPLADQLATVAVIERRLLFATIVALGIALALGSTAAALHARRIRRLEAAAERIAAGEFGEALTDSRDDELGDLARSFDRMRIQLAALDAARKEFVANASHELRTPLFSLGGFLELLADEDLDEETRARFLATTREQVDRLTRLATDLLDLSRMDAGRMRLEREPVDLSETAIAVADELAPLADASGHTLVLDCDAEAIAVGDEERIAQIVRALAQNALVHTPAGTRVQVRTRTLPGSAVVEIEDGGPGVPGEHADAVFQRFYRVDGNRASGSGLGLTIARELADRMGGSLVLRSYPGRTIFALSLPREPAGPAAVPTQAGRVA